MVGTILITLKFGSTIELSSAGILLLAACFLWGLDNNLTRDIEDVPASLVTCAKGLSAGGFNLLLALVLEGGGVSVIPAIQTLFIGAFSYGLSLFLFVKALRLIGTSRTATYFSIGPFVGVATAFVFLGERPPLVQWIAGGLMAVGVWWLYREDHEHEHSHRHITHRHRHSTDEHHRPTHDGTEGPEPHEHLHTHEPLTHTHPHLPDIHHRYLH